MIRTAVVAQTIDPARIAAEVSSDDYGAISIFLGTVRNKNGGRPVDGIEYTAYNAMAERELDKIAKEAADRFSIGSLVVEHRIGFLRLGEVSVAIAAAHAHRDRAMDCSRFVIEQIKERVPIWKLEHYSDGTREWVDPTAQVKVGAPWR
jgi:molybdopterin synthase catalytic subunit